MAKKKLIAGVDYEAFSWTDYIGGPYSYVQKFEQADAARIVRNAPLNKQFVKALDGAKKVFVDELTHNGQRFYGKARIVHVESKAGSVYEILISYNTAVCMFDAAGRFIRLWNGYSATTARHIDAFRRRCGLCGVNKAAWLALPIGKWNGGAENCIA